MFININGDVRRIKSIASASIPGVVTIATEDGQTVSIELAAKPETKWEGMLMAALAAAINNRNEFMGQK